MKVLSSINLVSILSRYSQIMENTDIRWLFVQLFVHFLSRGQVGVGILQDSND